jgi:PAS domain S-box-containing protein
VTALAPITSLEGKQGITAFYLAAVVAATVIGGLWAGLIATALSLLGLDYFFVEPINSLRSADKDPLITGAVASILAVVFIDRVQRRREAVQRRAERAEEEMASRARREEALANLGRIALTVAPRERLYGEVVSLVADALDVELSSLLEVAPGGEEAIIRAGVGWREGTLGAAVSTGPDSLAGHTLSRDEPVVIDDLRGDGRFAGSPILHEHQVVSGVVVPIPGVEGHFGVLSAMSRSRRRFPPDDVQFVRVAATMVGSAVERRSAQDALREARDEFQALIEASAIPIVAYDRDGIVTLWNPAAERVFGWSAEEAVGRFLPIVPEYMRDEFDLLREAVLAGRSFSGFETTRQRKDGSAIEISVSNAPVRDALGNVRGVVALDADITERKRADRAIRESEERLRRALEAAAMGWWEWDIETGEVRWSDNFEQIHGLPRGAIEGTFEAILRLVHPDDRAFWQEAVERAVAEKSDYGFEFRVVWPDGSVHWMQGIGHVVIEGADKPARLLALRRDITERRQREDALAFVAEASEALSRSLDYERTLREVARLAVPRLADCCVVDMIEERSVHQLAVVHVDPDMEQLVRDLEQRYPTDPELAASPMGRALRTGQAELVSSLSDELLAEYARDEEHAAGLRRLRLGSAMFLPLTARGRTSGVMAFLAGSGRRYTPSDLSLAEDLARTAALAVDNARLYRQRSRIARTLQRSLLPPELPVIPGIEVAARYEAAGEGLEVGGDFYDLFEAGPRDWAIVIGDVCGKGADAAAVTGLARYTIRTASMGEQSPSAVLRTLNDAVLRQYSQGTFCTVVCGRLAEGAAGRRTVLACGGHPLPFLLGADGEVRIVGTNGSLLGVFPDPELEDSEIELDPGDALVLYTDGLVEHYDPSLAAGEKRLAEVLRESAGLPAEEIASRIERSIHDIGNGSARDDIAFVVLKVIPA